MTRVVIPATDNSPHLEAVRAALAGVEHETHLLHDDQAYWRLLSDLWAQQQTIILVEHDIISSPEAVRELIDCDQDWCCSSYPYGERRGTIIGLGMTKFTRAIMRRVPDALERAFRVVDRTHPTPGHWCRLDSSLTRVLVDSGETQHFQGHMQVEHLNHGRSAHGCR